MPPLDPAHFQSFFPVRFFCCLFVVLTFFRFPWAVFPHRGRGGRLGPPLSFPVFFTSFFCPFLCGEQLFAFFATWDTLSFSALSLPRRPSPLRLRVTSSLVFVTRLFSFVFLAPFCSGLVLFFYPTWFGRPLFF